MSIISSEQAKLKKIVRRLGLSPQIAKEGAGSFALRATFAGLSFLSTVLFARLLGAEGYGIYTYALSWVMLLSMPAQAGLPNLIMRETARGLAHNRPDLVIGIWRWSGHIVVGFSLVLVLVLGPILIIWQGGFSTAQGVTLAWALLLVPLLALGNLRGAALRGLKRVLAGQLPEFFIRPGLLVLLIVSIGYLTKWQLSPNIAMILNVIAALIAFLVGAWMLWRNTPTIVQHAVPLFESKKWITSTVFFTMISGFSVINKQASTIILGFFVSPDQIGIYRVAVQVATLASFGLQAVNMVVAPRFANIYARKDIDKLQRLVTGSAKVALIFNVALTLFFVLAGKPFFNLVFGIEFDASYAPLLILLVGQMVNSTAGSVGILLNMTGHERDTTRGMGLSAGLNLVLHLVLIPLWGIRGAAVATAISMIVWNVLLWLAVRNRLKINSLAFNVKI